MKPTKINAQQEKKKMRQEKHKKEGRRDSEK